MSKIIAIIPARSGSKRIKNKNIKKIFGKPMIAWTIIAAKKSKFFDKVLVSTDSNKIAKIAKFQSFLEQPMGHVWWSGYPL